MAYKAVIVACTLVSKLPNTACSVWTCLGPCVVLQKFSTRCEDLLGSCKPLLALIIRARDFSVHKGRACANRVSQAVFQQRAKSGLGRRLPF